jgi:hypothetical protein
MQQLGQWFLQFNMPWETLVNDGQTLAFRHTPFSAWAWTFVCFGIGVAGIGPTVSDGRVTCYLLFLHLRSSRVFVPAAMHSVSGIDVAPSLFLLCIFFPVAALYFCINPSEDVVFDRRSDLVTMTMYYCCYCRCGRRERRVRLSTVNAIKLHQLPSNLSATRLLLCVETDTHVGEIPMAYCFNTGMSQDRQSRSQGIIDLGGRSEGGNRTSNRVH